MHFFRRGTLQLILPLVALYSSQYIDGENDDVILVTRLAAGACLAVMLAVYARVWQRIHARNDGSELTYPDPTVKPPKKKKKQAAADGVPPPVVPLIFTTPRDYDSTFLWTEVRTSMLSACVTGVMHVWFGMYAPALVYCASVPALLFDSPLVHIHLLDAAATGEYSRPFKDAAGMFDLVKDEWSSLKKEMAAPDAPAAAAPVVVDGRPVIPAEPRNATEAAEAFRRRFSGRR